MLQCVVNNKKSVYFVIIMKWTGLVKSIIHISAQFVILTKWARLVWFVMYMISNTWICLLRDYYKVSRIGKVYNVYGVNCLICSLCDYHKVSEIGLICNVYDIKYLNLLTSWLSWSKLARLVKFVMCIVSIIWNCSLCDNHEVNKIDINCNVNDIKYLNLLTSWLSQSEQDW